MQNLRANNIPPHPPLSSSYRHSSNGKPYSISSLSSARATSKPKNNWQINNLQSSSSNSRASENLLKSIQKKRKENQLMTGSSATHYNQASKIQAIQISNGLEAFRRQTVSQNQRQEDKENQDISCDLESSRLANTKCKSSLIRYEDNSALKSLKSEVKSTFTASAQQTYLLSAQKQPHEIEDVLANPQSESNLNFYNKLQEHEYRESLEMLKSGSDTYIQQDVAVASTQSRMYERSVHLSASKNGRAVSIYKNQPILQENQNTMDRSKLLNQPRPSISFSVQRQSIQNRALKKQEGEDDQTQAYNTRITYQEQQTNQYQNLRDQLKIEEYEEKSTNVRPTVSPSKVLMDNNVSVDVHSTSSFSDSSSKQENCLQKHAKENQKSCKVLNPFSSVSSQNPKNQWEYSTIQSAVSSVHPRNAPNENLGQRNHISAVSQSLNQKAIMGIQSVVNQASTAVKELRINLSEARKNKAAQGSKGFARGDNDFSSTQGTLQLSTLGKIKLEEPENRFIKDANFGQSQQKLNQKLNDAIKNSTSSSLFTATNSSRQAGTNIDNLQKQPSFGNQSSIHYGKSKNLKNFTETIDLRKMSQNSNAQKQNPRGCSKLSINLLPQRVSACSQIANLNHSQVPKIQDKPQAKKITDDSDQETIDSQDMSSIIQDLKTLEKQTSQGAMSQGLCKKGLNVTKQHLVSGRALQNDPQTLQSFDRKNDMINLHIQSTESLNKELFSFNDGLFSAQSKQMSLKDLKQDQEQKATSKTTNNGVPHLNLKLNLPKNQKPLDTLTLIQGLQTIANGGGMSCRSNSSGRQRARWDLSGGKSTLQNSFRKGSDTESLFEGGVLKGKHVENEDRLLKVNKSPLTQENILKMNFDDDTCTRQYEQLQKQYQAIKQQLKYFKQLKSSQQTHSSQHNSHMHQQSLNSNSIFNQFKIDQSKISRALAKGENEDLDQQDFGTLVTEQQFFTQNQMSSDDDFKQGEKSGYSQEADGESQDEDILNFKKLKRAKKQGISTTNAKQSKRQQTTGHFKSIDLQQATKNILKTAMKNSASPHLQIQTDKQEAANKQLASDFRGQTRYLEDLEQSQDIVSLKRRLADDLQNMDRKSKESEQLHKKQETVKGQSKAGNSILKSQLQMGLRKLSETSSQFESKLYRNNQHIPLQKQANKQNTSTSQRINPLQSTIKSTKKKNGRGASNSQVSFVGVDSNDESTKNKDISQKNQQRNKNYLQDNDSMQEDNQKYIKSNEKQKQKLIKNVRNHDERESINRRESSRDQASIYRYDISRSEVSKLDYEKRKKSSTRVYDDRRSSRRESSRAPLNTDFTASKKNRSSSRHEKALYSTRGKESSRAYDQTPKPKSHNKSRRSKQNQSTMSMVNPWLPGYKTGLEAASINLLQQQLALAQSLQSPQLFQTQMLQPMLIPNQAAYLGLPPLLTHPTLQTQIFTQQASSTIPSQTPIQNPSIISSFPISKMHSPSSTMAPLQFSQTKHAALQSQTNSIQNQKHQGHLQYSQQQPLSAQSQGKNHTGHRTTSNVEPFQFKSFEQHQEQIEAIESLIQQAKDKLYTNIVSNTNQNCKLSSGHKDHSQLNQSALNSTRMRSNMIQRQIIDMNMDRDEQSCQDEIESRNPEMNQFINQSLSNSKYIPHPSRYENSQSQLKNSSRNTQRQVADSYNSNNSQQSRFQDRQGSQRYGEGQGSRNLHEGKLIFSTSNSNNAHSRQMPVSHRRQNEEENYQRGQESSRTNVSRQINQVAASDRSSLIAQIPDYRYQNEKLRQGSRRDREGTDHFQIEREESHDDRDYKQFNQRHHDEICNNSKKQRVPFEKRTQKRTDQLDSERQREKQRLIDEVVCQFVNDEDDIATNCGPERKDDKELMLWIDFDDSKSKQEVKRKQELMEKRMKGSLSSRQQSEQLTSSRTQTSRLNQNQRTQQEQSFAEASKSVSKGQSKIGQHESKSGANGGWAMDFTEKPSSPSQQQQAQSIAEAFKNRLQKAEQRFKKSAIEQEAQDQNDNQRKDFTKEELFERKKELLKAAREKIKSKNSPSLDPQGEVTQSSIAASKPPQHPGSLAQTSLSTSNPPASLLTRLSSGQRAEVSKRDMLKLTSKNYEQLPEIQQRKKDSTKKEDLLKRIQQVKQLESKRRQAVVSKQKQQQQPVSGQNQGTSRLNEKNGQEKSKVIE